MASDSGLEAAIALAETEAAARVAAAVSSAQIAASATEQSAVTQAQADTTVATTVSNANKAIAQIGATADVQVAGIRANADVAVSSNQLTGTEYSSDKQLTGVEYAQDAETGRLNTTLQFAQDKWNQVWPLLQGFLQNPNQGGSGQSASWASLASALGAAPWITQGGVWTPSQIQSQLNALYASSDQRAATRIHDAQIDLAGRGFGSSSPLLDMLTFAYESENMQASLTGARQISLDSSKANAEQLLAQQSGRLDEYKAQIGVYAELARVSEELAVGTLRAVADIISATVR